jgi:hypothetical protein
LEKEQFAIRDERGSDRSHLDNPLMRDYGWLIGAKTIGIYAILVMHAGKDQKAFPSLKRIEEMSALSKPTVIECIKLMDWLQIIRSIQLGKMCTNRYVLLDKKCWRKDWEVMLRELTTGEVNSFNPTSKAILIQRLNGFTSIVTRPNSNKTQVTKPASAAFERFWEIYPRKEAKVKARQAWEKHNLDEKVGVIITFVLAAKDLPRWKNIKYVPHGATFLNGERWLDDLKLYKDFDQQEVLETVKI